MTQKHTPLPWQVYGKNGTSDINGPIEPTRIAKHWPMHGGHQVIADTYYETASGGCNTPKNEAEANAAFIVRAVNSHYELLEALKDFANGASTGAIKSDHDETFANLLRKTHATIAKAEGRS